MRQEVLKVGTSAGVIIPKKILQELGLKIGDYLQVDTDSKTLSMTIRPEYALSKKDKKIMRFGYEFIREYKKDLEALAGK